MKDEDYNDVEDEVEDKDLKFTTAEDYMKDIAAVKEPESE